MAPAANDFFFYDFSSKKDQWDQAANALLEYYRDEPSPLNDIRPRKELPPAPVQAGQVECDETVQILWWEPTPPQPLFQEVEAQRSRLDIYEPEESILDIYEPEESILPERKVPLHFYWKTNGFSCEDHLVAGLENLIVTPPRSRSSSLRSKEAEGVAEAVVEEPILLDDVDGSQNGKRERSMSSEVLPKYYCRTKLQKDLVIGRPRRSSIRDTPRLCYGLRPMQCLVNDIDSGVYKLVMNVVAAPSHRKGAAQLLTTQLETVATDQAATPDLVLAILQVLQAQIYACNCKSDYLYPAVNLALFKDIVSLKELHSSMLSELEAKELETEGCLKEVVTKYASIHATTMFGDVKLLLMKALYEKHRRMILQSFRDRVLALSTLPLCTAYKDFAVPPELTHRARMSQRRLITSS